VFLPIHHDRMVVARRPWVTLAIVVLCLAAHVLISYSSGDEEAAGRFAEALAFYALHPETEPDRRLAPPGLIEQIRLQSPVGADPDPDPRRSQTELDLLTETWLESLERAPRWRFGLIPARWRTSTLFTHAFLHAGLLHLFGNLFLLYLTAPLVEDAIGRTRFALLYLALGAIAGFAYSLHVPDLFRPMIGASGAISAVLGLFVVLHARLRLRYLLWIGVPLGTFEAPAWTMLPVWFGLQVLLGLGGADAAAADSGGVAYWAHAWGFVGGVVAGFALRHRRTTIDVAPPDPVGLARKAIDFGRPEDAWNALTAEIRADPERTDAVRELWELARRLDRVPEAIPAFARLVWREARRGDPFRAYELWLELRGDEGDRPADPVLAAWVADALDRSGEGREALDEVLESGLAGLGAETQPAVAARLRQLAASSRSREVAAALAAAALRDDLPGALRKALAQTPK
jgi:membrane associated rhomboid family serine protease